MTDDQMKATILDWGLNSSDEKIRELAARLSKEPKYVDPAQGDLFPLTLDKTLTRWVPQHDA